VTLHRERARGPECRPPILHEIDTLSARNARRMCVVREDLGTAEMLAVGDAERLMGFPAGWTEAGPHTRSLFTLNLT
jgi:hypothetical protein